jgi:hypothetical protein
MSWLGVGACVVIIAGVTWIARSPPPPRLPGSLPGPAPGVVASTADRRGDTEMDPARPVDPPVPPPSVDCRSKRFEVHRARRRGQWTAVLDGIDSTCWATRVEHARLQVQALLELRELEAGVQAGHGIDDPLVVTIVNRCRTLSRREPP